MVIVDECHHVAAFTFESALKAAEGIRGAGLSGEIRCEGQRGRRNLRRPHLLPGTHKTPYSLLSDTISVPQWAVKYKPTTIQKLIRRKQRITLRLLSAPVFSTASYFPRWFRSARQNNLPENGSKFRNSPPGFARSGAEASARVPQKHPSYYLQGVWHTETPR